MATENIEHLSLANGFLWVTIVEDPKTQKIHALLGNGTHVKCKRNFTSRAGARRWAIKTGEETIKLMQRELKQVKSRWLLDYQLLIVSAILGVAVGIAGLAQIW